MKNRLTEMFGIEFPIFAFSHCRDVVAAVTNAGGCGVLGAVAHSPEQLDIDLRWIEDEVKGKPYGVDLLVPEKFVGADEGGLDRDSLAGLVPEYVTLPRGVRADNAPRPVRCATSATGAAWNSRSNSSQH